MLFKTERIAIFQITLFKDRVQISVHFFFFFYYSSLSLPLKAMNITTAGLTSSATAVKVVGHLCGT